MNLLIKAISCHRLRAICELVEASSGAEILGDTFKIAFHRGSQFTLAYRGRFFIMLATACLGENTGFFTGPFEATQREVKWFIVLYFN